MTQTSKQLIAAIAEKTGVSKTDVEASIKGLEDVLIASITTDEKVSLPSFGSFKFAFKEASVGRNPKTNTSVDVAAKYTMKFAASKGTKDSLKAAAK